jgi:hypothetical protein
MKLWTDLRIFDLLKYKTALRADFVNIKLLEMSSYSEMDLCPN